MALKNRTALMFRIQQYGFLADDIKLFLNTHPCCEGAVEAMNDSLRQRARAIANYEARFGAIRVSAAKGQTTYAWHRPPWPWETEASDVVL